MFTSKKSEETIIRFFLTGRPIMKKIIIIIRQLLIFIHIVYINSFNEFLVGGRGGYDFNVLSEIIKNLVVLRLLVL
jgi:hypothetical protein